RTPPWPPRSAERGSPPHHDASTSPDDRPSTRLPVRTSAQHQTPTQYDRDQSLTGSGRDQHAGEEGDDDGDLHGPENEDRGLPALTSLPYNKVCQTERT